MINVIVFAVMFYHQLAKARRALLQDKESRWLKKRVEELEKKATSLYSIEVSVKVEDAQRLVSQVRKILPFAASIHVYLCCGQTLKLETKL